MKHYLGGYYLVKKCPWEPYMENGRPRRLLPENIWTIGNICEKYPDEWIFGWERHIPGMKLTGRFSEVYKEDYKPYQDLLNMNEVEFKKMQADYNHQFNENAFGYPHVFYSLQEAIQFYQKYLFSLNGIKLLSISLTEKHRDMFIADGKREKDVYGHKGVFRMLLKNEILNENVGTSLGYDILGFDGGQISYIWSHFAPDFEIDLGIIVNNNGFIASLEQAERASLYTESRDCNYDWHPWLVYEYSLPK